MGMFRNVFCGHWRNIYLLSAYISMKGFCVIFSSSFICGQAEKIRNYVHALSFTMVKVNDVSFHMSTLLNDNTFQIIRKNYH